MALDAAGSAFADAVGANVEAMLAAPLVAAAQAAVAAVQADKGRGAAEAGADTADARLAVAGAVNDAEARLAVYLADAFARGLAAGWLAEIRGQNEVLPASVTLTAQDAKDVAASLAGYPILGHTPAETADYQAAAWRFGAEGALGAAAAMGDPAAIPPGMAEQARLAGGRASSAAAEAFHAGAQAARKAIGIVLARGVNG